jgi:hypothetical protein
VGGGGGGVCVWGGGDAQQLAAHAYKLLNCSLKSMRNGLTATARGSTIQQQKSTCHQSPLGVPQRASCVRMGAKPPAFHKELWADDGGLHRRRYA